MCTKAELARAARYRQRRRARIGEEADKKRARAARAKTFQKHRNRILEEKRAANHRNTKRRTKPAIGMVSAISLVTAREIKLDATRWTGPGANKERKLEKQADQILAAARRREIVNAAQIDRLKKQAQHETETPRCTGLKCWCGLCHCTRCQRQRRETAEPEIDQQIGEDKP